MEIIRTRRRLARLAARPVLRRRLVRLRLARRVWRITFTLPKVTWVTDPPVDPDDAHFFTGSKMKAEFTWSGTVDGETYDALLARIRP